MKRSQKKMTDANALPSGNKFACKHSEIISAVTNTARIFLSNSHAIHIIGV
jgi:hypothetical protein